MAPTKVVLLSCGSFNPPTHMHLRMFELARDHLNRVGQYWVVGGILSPVHDSYGKQELVSVMHRCAMLQLAIESSDWLYLSDWECGQLSWLPTRQVLQHHQNVLKCAVSAAECEPKRLKHESEMSANWVCKALKDYSNEDSKRGVRVMLLCGGDMLQSFNTPGLWLDADIETIVGEHGLVVITRSGTNPYQVIYESDALTRFQNNIEIVTEWMCNEVSSTKIRRALRRSESAKYLVADSVLEYIRNNDLYAPVDKS